MKRIESLLIPYEQYTLSSSLSIQEINRRMLDNVEPPRRRRDTGDTITKPFLGTVTDQGFNIYRIIYNRNSFLPTVIGQYETDKDKTLIQVRVRMSIFSYIFMGIWMGIVGVICVVMLVVWLEQLLTFRHPGFSSWLLIPYGLFIFGCALIIVGFKSESARAKEFLTGLLCTSS